jgi:uncharacterized protein (TIGR02284 family)
MRLNQGTFMAEDRHFNTESDKNRDPISGEPGSHPVGTGIGAALGGAGVGAAAGMVAGPAGALVGAVAGAVAGGYGGKAAAEAINPTAEEAWWRENYDKTSYYEAGRPFDDYAPAYRLGVTGRVGYSGSFDDYEGQLADGWDAKRGSSTLSWPQARSATRDAWDRVDSRISASPENYRADAAMAGVESVGTVDAVDALGSAGDDMDSMDSMDNDDVIDTLNDLLESCRDGEFGYRECAEHIKAPNLKDVLQRHEKSCRDAGAELQALIVQLGGEADEGGSMTGALHRGWVSVRGTLMGNSDQAMMDECERGEDSALASYRKALKQPLPASVRALVQRQSDGAQRNHDEIKALRDSLKASS